MIEITPLLIFSIIWFILPPYIANMAPAVWGGGPPIDGEGTFWMEKDYLAKVKPLKALLWEFSLG